MDREQLLTFERIVREGSFSKAARSLNIAQPTISARIQALEEAVGGQLFQRGGRGVTLTERGESFLPYARHALAILAEGVETARLTQSGQRGRVTLAAMQSLAEGFLAHSIARFYQTHPLVDVSLQIAHSDEIVAMLIDGVVKLGLIGYPFQDRNLRTLLRLREPMVLVLPALHPLAGCEDITLAELRQSKSPLFQVRWGSAIDSLLQSITIPGQPVIEVPFSTARHLLLHGLGAALLTRTTVSEELADGRLVAIRVRDVPTVYRDSALVTLAHGEPLPSALRDFITTLLDEAANSSAFIGLRYGDEIVGP
ncbi:LysR family transcriptional regulator [Ktedonospora formicarum]|uniref:HTH lysR-type domain-containing protein n=1 Tax=Ktedonospora formicarum TaxID=2778364 RepID=A0A8J3MTA4_9CHLR|nr:LysR family transcriptional regulator [Ktedonospora formicarum]GHO45418.1 hypothetical protein KSX_35810 [Ktedonospora formicarum]